MKKVILALVALGLIAQANAQLWSGLGLPPAWPFAPGIDSYFVPAGPTSEFDDDAGKDFSLMSGGTIYSDIDGANGWFNAANYAVTLQNDDRVRVTYLGKTAGWVNDFGLNIGGTNASGAGARTLWSGITNASPGHGSQFTFDLVIGGPIGIDFWLNSGGPLAPVEPALGGTYSIFYPATSNPGNTFIGDGLPGYSARGKIFNTHDSVLDANRSILVIAIEDWRNFDADFTDMFFAIEIYDKDGGTRFPVPEPSTYGLIGAMMLLGLVAVRRARRS